MSKEEKAYLALLCCHPAIRADLQKVLCNLRDSIAESKGISQQQAQEQFEAMALADSRNWLTGRGEG